MSSPGVSRPVCPRCRRPMSGCWCSQLPLLQTRTRVVVLQHRREARVAIGTGRMASLCLPNSELHVGLTWDEDPSVRAALSDPGRPAVLLFPGPEAPDILTCPPDHPVTLVVVDGTWSQASKIVRRSPMLSALPRYAFHPPRPSDYRIRREPRAECVSTIEALVHVLGVLEGDPEGVTRMLAPFRAMVDYQLAWIERSHEPRRRHRTPKPPPPLPAGLDTQSNGVIFAAGEVNTWPRRPPTGIPDELVHWVAVRPATGDRFEAVIAPQHPLAQATARHVEIPEEQLQAGETWEAFEARWAAFLRPGDTLVTWGCFASNLLRAHQGTLPARHLDCRAVLRERLKRKIGTPEDWLMSNQIPIPAPIGMGRAGLRLGLLVAVVKTLTETKLS